MDNVKIDLRKIPFRELKKIKIEAMDLRDKGISNKEVAKQYHLDPSVVSRWYRQYIKNFRQLKDPIKRGRKKGTQTSLTEYQEEVIIKTLQESNAVIDKQVVKNVIEKKYNIILPTSTVGDYLKKWGVNSSFIKDFENDFIKRAGEGEFQSFYRVIKRQNGVVIWIKIMDFEQKDSVKFQSIITRVSNNKLIFKLYKTRIQAVDFIDFVNHIATLFTKQLYVIFDAENIECIDKEKCFDNNKKITFIYCK